jgi:hypothetical protein
MHPPHWTQRSKHPNLAHPAAGTHPRGIGASDRRICPHPAALLAAAYYAGHSRFQRLASSRGRCSGLESALRRRRQRVCCSQPCRGTAPGAIAAAFDPRALMSRTSRPAVCRPGPPAVQRIGPPGPVDHDADRRPSRAGSGWPAATGRGSRLSAPPAAGGARHMAPGVCRGAS